MKDVAAGGAKQRHKAVRVRCAKKNIIFVKYSSNTLTLWDGGYVFRHRRTIIWSIACSLERRDVEVGRR
jgi:hypothetical protein